MAAALVIAAATPSVAEDAGVPDCSHPPDVQLPGGEGAAILDLTISTDGSVKAAQIVQSSGNVELDKFVATCMPAKWHFMPATQNGLPVEAHKKYRVVLKIQ